jgi:hypothetical protein
MLQSLKREQPRAAREALLGGSSGGGAAPGSKETDATAELGNQGLLQLQQQVMQQQDQELESLERTVVGTKHIALQVTRVAVRRGRGREREGRRGCPAGMVCDSCGIAA